MQDFNKNIKLHLLRYHFQVLLNAAKLESDLADLDVGLEDVERTPEVMKPNATVHS